MSGAQCTQNGSMGQNWCIADGDLGVLDVNTIEWRIRGFTTMRYINLRFTYLLNGVRLPKRLD